MAVTHETLRISRQAAADLRLKQFCFVKLDSANKIALAGAGELAVGVLIDKPNINEWGTIAVGGITKVISAGTIAPNVLVEPNADSHAVAASTGEDAAALTLATSVDNDVVEVLLTPGAQAE